MADAFLWLRSFHMLFGILWAGGAMYRMMSLERARNDETRRDAVLGSKFSGPYMGATSLGTFSFGLAAMLTNSSDIAYKFEGLGDGFFLFHGALGLATFALLLGFAAHLPTEAKLIKCIAAKRAGQAYPEAQYAVLCGRAHMLARISGGLLVLAMLGMTFFRAFA